MGVCVCIDGSGAGRVGVSMPPVPGVRGLPRWRPGVACWEAHDVARAGCIGMPGEHWGTSGGERSRGRDEGPCNMRGDSQPVSAPWQCTTSAPEYIRQRTSSAPSLSFTSSFDHIRSITLNHEVHEGHEDSPATTDLEDIRTGGLFAALACRYTWSADVPACHFWGC